METSWLVNGVSLDLPSLELHSPLGCEGVWHVQFCSDEYKGILSISLFKSSIMLLLDSRHG